MSVIRALGVSRVRDDFLWTLVQHQPGRYDWRLPDELVSVAAQYGLTFLPTLDGTPSWAGPEHNGVPLRTEAYARFVSLAVARYGPGGTFWRRNRSLPQRPIRFVELFNEPFLPVPKGHGPPDPAAYARLVAAVAPAARKANRHVRILISGETTYAPGNGQQPRSWMADMYAAVPNLGRFFDGVAVHPYSLSSPTIYTPTLSASRWDARRLELIRAEMINHGDGAKHLWITEAGWSTCPQGGSCVSEKDQASFLRQFLSMTRTRWARFVDAVFVYELQDHATRNARDGTFGIMRADGRVKPAWHVVRDVVRSQLR